jgi:HPt (histidine-containing phosphotransfer) domain-containing protein
MANRTVVEAEVDMSVDDEAVGRIRAIGGDLLVEQMIELFVIDVPARLERLRCAVAAGDRTAVARAAHSIRGSAATLGALAVARLCTELELAAKVPETNLGAGIDALADAISLASEELRGLAAAGR